MPMHIHARAVRTTVYDTVYSNACPCTRYQVSFLCLVASRCFFFVTIFYFGARVFGYIPAVSIYIYICIRSIQVCMPLYTGIYTDSAGSSSRSRCFGHYCYTVVLLYCCLFLLHFIPLGATE